MENSQFRLSNSFTNLFLQKGTQNSNSDNNAEDASNTDATNKGLFKLNPKSAEQNMPIEALEGRSKQRL
jgi:hypothetical protein